MINFFDLLVVLIIIGLGISGYREGLIRGIVKLLGFIITIVVIAVFSDQIIQRSHELEFISPTIAVPVTFIVLLVIGIIGFNILARIIHKVVHMTPVGFIDSGLGTAFGILKALFLSGVIALALSFTPPDTFFREQFKTSRSAAPLVNLLSEAIPFVKSTAGSFYERVFPLPAEPEKEKNEESSPDNII